MSIGPLENNVINFNIFVNPEGEVTPEISVLPPSDPPKPLQEHQVVQVKVEPVHAQASLKPSATDLPDLKDLKPKPWSVWKVRGLMFAITVIIAAGAVLGYHFGVKEVFTSPLSLKQWLILGGLGAGAAAITSYALYNIHHYNFKVLEKAHASTTDSTKLVSKSWWERRSWEEKSLIVVISSVAIAYFLAAGVIAANNSGASTLDFLATPWRWIGSTFQPSQVAIFFTAYSVAVPVIVYLGLTAYWHRKDEVLEESERNIEERLKIVENPPPTTTPPVEPSASVSDEALPNPISSQTPAPVPSPSPITAPIPTLAPAKSDSAPVPLPSPSPVPIPTPQPTVLQPPSVSLGPPQILPNVPAQALPLAVLLDPNLGRERVKDIRDINGLPPDRLPTAEEIRQRTVDTKYNR